MKKRPIPQCHPNRCEWHFASPTDLGPEFLVPIKVYTDPLTRLVMNGVECAPDADVVWDPEHGVSGHETEHPDGLLISIEVSGHVFVWIQPGLVWDEEWAQRMLWVGSPHYESMVHALNAVTLFSDHEHWGSGRIALPTAPVQTATNNTGPVCSPIRIKNWTDHAVVLPRYADDAVWSTAIPHARSFVQLVVSEKEVGCRHQTKPYWIPFQLRRWQRHMSLYTAIHCNGPSIHATAQAVSHHCFNDCTHGLWAMVHPAFCVVGWCLTPKRENRQIMVLDGLLGVKYYRKHHLSPKQTEVFTATAETLVPRPGECVFRLLACGSGPNTLNNDTMIFGACPWTMDAYRSIRAAWSASVLSFVPLADLVNLIWEYVDLVHPL